MPRPICFIEGISVRPVNGSDSSQVDSEPDSNPYISDRVMVDPYPLGSEIKSVRKSSLRI
ncbi:hypothetical protein AXF42_Ash008981 [Apostasia shenzhenica]|uniref:Uncharacterized protein n=1 Tax=Apostasia shenzhenica TaxID=1088818 RepID=A0A2I0AT24_9ASPA|nr:hypothetical protein AXF42_Ash008981 [Apostasia shenzhenica]